jgi:hypothetical protein
LTKLTKKNLVPPCPTAPYSTSKSLPKAWFRSLKFVLCWSLSAPTEFFDLSAFCRSTSSFLRVLRY